LVGTSFPCELPDRHSRSEASEPYERPIRVSSNQTALFRTAWSRCRLLEPRTVPAPPRLPGITRPPGPKPRRS